MSVPATRQEFSDYCLRRLGSPVININVATEQIDDRIDDALSFFYEYWHEGTEKTYYIHAITSQDITNRYITLPGNIIGAVRLFDPSTYGSIANMFDIRYQIALNDLYTLTAQSLVPYYMTMQHLSLIEDLLVGHKPIRFNRYNNICYIDMDWAQYGVGEFLMIEAYQIMDPDVYAAVWGDRWLLRYGTALIKKNWAENVKKFGGMAMPGGITINGQEMYNEAVAEIDMLEQQSRDLSIPTQFIWG